MRGVRRSSSESIRADKGRWCTANEGRGMQAPIRGHGLQSAVQGWQGGGERIHCSPPPICSHPSHASRAHPIPSLSSL